MPERPKDFDYQRYLASREWAVLKEQVKERNEGWCEHCHAAKHQDTHHLTYERIGNEQLDDLMGLCRPCHEWVSGKSDKNPLRNAWVISPTLQRQDAPPVHLYWQMLGDESYPESWRNEQAIGYVICSHPRFSRFGKCQWCEIAETDLGNFFYAVWFFSHNMGGGSPNG